MIPMMTALEPPDTGCPNRVVMLVVGVVVTMGVVVVGLVVTTLGLVVVGSVGGLVGGGTSVTDTSDIGNIFKFKEPNVFITDWVL